MSYLCAPEAEGDAPAGAIAYLLGEEGGIRVLLLSGSEKEIRWVIKKKAGEGNCTSGPLPHDQLAKVPDSQLDGR